jgi:hypothetical protein
MKFAAFTVLIGALCFAGPAQKPVCKVGNRGQFWPAEANFNRDAARQLYQSGELEMCTLVVWKYKWEHVSVNVHNVAKGMHPSDPQLQETGTKEGK